MPASTSMAGRNRNPRQRVPENGLARYRSLQISGSPSNTTTNLMWTSGGGARPRSEVPGTGSYGLSRQAAERRCCRGCCAVRFTTGVFHTRYNDRRSSPDTGLVERCPSYMCLPIREMGDNRVHCSIQAEHLDTAIEQLLFKILTPVAVDGIHDVIRQELRQYEGLLRVRQADLRRAEERAADAERAFLDAGPTWPHVTQRLGQRFDQALAELETLRTTHRLQPVVLAVSPDLATLEELRALLGDLPALWRHPTVTAEQRKTLLRAVVNAIYATRDDSGQWILEVNWASGARTTLPPIRVSRRKRADRVKRRRGQPISREVYQRIRDQVMAGKSIEAIADDLNAIQAPHGRGGAWSKARVAGAACRLRKGVVPDVERLPPVNQMTIYIRQLHEAGHSPAAIVDLLNRQGHQTKRRTPFTVDTVRATIVRLGFRSHFAEHEDRVRNQLEELSQSMLPADVASHLNQLGLTTQQGLPWTPYSVREKQLYLGISCRRQRARYAVEPAQPKATESSDTDAVRPTD